MGVNTSWKNTHSKKTCLPLTCRRTDSSLARSKERHSWPWPQRSESDWLKVNMVLLIKVEACKSLPLSFALFIIVGRPMFAVSSLLQNFAGLWVARLLWKVVRVAAARVIRGGVLLAEIFEFTFGLSCLRLPCELSSWHADVLLELWKAEYNTPLLVITWARVICCSKTLRWEEWVFNFGWRLSGLYYRFLLELACLGLVACRPIHEFHL